MIIAEVLGPTECTNDASSPFKRTHGVSQLHTFYMNAFFIYCIKSLLASKRHTNSVLAGLNLEKIVKLNDIKVNSD